MICSFIDSALRKLLLILNIALIGTGLVSIYFSAIKYIGTATLSVAIMLALSKSVLYEKLIKTLNASIDKIGFENSRFNDENNKLTEAIDKMKLANTKLLEIQKQSQALMTSLMSSGDKFTDFGKILEESTNKSVSLADKMQLLINGLSKKDFDKMDVNHDGAVSAEEFNNYFKN